MLTEFREAIQAQLEAAIGIPFVAGTINGPVGDRNIGCVWVASVNNMDDLIDVQTIDLRVRAFRQWKQETTPGYQPEHVEALETLAEQVQTGLAAIQASLASVWYFHVVGVELDLETMGVEASLIAYQQNPMAA